MTHPHSNLPAILATRFQYRRRGGLHFAKIASISVSWSQARRVYDDWEGRKLDLSNSDSFAEDILWTLVYLVVWPAVALAVILAIAPWALPFADWLAATLGVIQ